MQDKIIQLVKTIEDEKKLEMIYEVVVHLL